MIASTIAAACTSLVLYVLTAIFKGMVLGSLEIGLSIGTMADASGTLTKDDRLSNLTYFILVTGVLIGGPVGYVGPWWLAIIATSVWVIGLEAFRFYKPNRRRRRR